jgi:thiamine biosynthesis lipoprotein
LKVTNWKLLEVRPEQRAVLQPGNVHLDLSSIAKGYGVDQVARYLRGLGIASFLVEVGGELRGLGTKEDGQPWWVELETKPMALSTNTPTNMVALHDLSIATSGDYLRCFEYQGQQYSHTIDPRSGYPIMHGLASVTVLHAQCMVADALATAMSVMGLEEGLRYANQLDVAALFLQRTANGLEEHMSLHFKRMTAE